MPDPAPKDPLTRDPVLGGPADGLEWTRNPFYIDGNGRPDLPIACVWVKQRHRYVFKNDAWRHDLVRPAATSTLELP